MVKRMLAAIAVVLACTPAQAVRFYEQIGSTTAEVVLPGDLGLDPGSYHFRFDLSAFNPGSSVPFVELHYHTFCSGNPCGGNLIQSPLFFVTQDYSHYSADFALLPARTRPEGPNVFSEFFPDRLAGNFLLFESTPMNYKITISAVPEAPAWALTIAGFVIMGAATRRGLWARTQVVKQSVLITHA